MRRLHRLSAKAIRSTSLCVCFAVVLSGIAGVPFQTASSKDSIRLLRHGNGQGNGRERRVSPPAPRTGSPAENLPNLSEVQHRRFESSSNSDYTDFLGYRSILQPGKTME